MGLTRRKFIKALAAGIIALQISPETVLSVAEKLPKPIKAISTKAMSEMLKRIYAPRIADLFEKHTMFYDILKKNPNLVAEKGEGYYFNITRTQ